MNAEENGLSLLRALLLMHGYAQLQKVLNKLTQEVQ